jgi:hypothetical protein
MAEHNRIDDEPPVGMLPDGTLNIVQPDSPIHKPRILGPDGTEYTLEDLDENGDLKTRYEPSPEFIAWSKKSQADAKAILPDSRIREIFREARDRRRANEHIIRERRQRSTGTDQVTPNPSPTKE